MVAAAAQLGIVAAVPMAWPPRHVRGATSPLTVAWFTPLKGHSSGPGLDHEWGWQQGNHMTEATHDRCVAACKECAEACNELVAACLRESNLEDVTHLVALNLSCAAFCQFVGGAIVQLNEFLEPICSLCRNVCIVCGDECKRLDVAEGLACSRACYACADSCQKVVDQVVRTGGLAAELKGPMH